MRGTKTERAYGWRRRSCNRQTAFCPPKRRSANVIAFHFHCCLLRLPPAIRNFREELHFIERPRLRHILFFDAPRRYNLLGVKAVDST